MPEDMQGFIQNKGWADPEAAVSSYRSLEALQGVPENQLLKLPSHPDDKEAWDAVYSKLGRPAEAGGYDFGPGIATADGQVDLTPEFQAWAHNANLSQQQAKSVFDAFQQRMGTLESESETAMKLEADQDIKDLHTQWGQAFDQKVQAGKAFAQRFNLDAGKLTALESALGTKGLLEFTAMLGEAIGEHGGPPQDILAAGAEGQQFGLTPAHAKAKIEELKLDKEFQNKIFVTGDKTAKEHWRMLHEAAFPGEVVAPIVSATQRP